MKINISLTKSVLYYTPQAATVVAFVFASLVVDELVFVIYDPTRNICPPRTHTH